MAASMRVFICAWHAADTVARFALALFLIEVGLSPPFDQPRRIARHQVDFEIDRITGAQRSESRYL